MAGFQNFGELYRAAFAERDSERKLVLLHEVHMRLKSWELSESENEPNSRAGRHIVPRPVSPAIDRVQAA